MEKRVPSYTISKHINSYSHYGEQYGGSFVKLLDKEGKELGLE